MRIGSQGLNQTESDTADLYVCYQAAVSQEKQFNSYSNDMAMGLWPLGGWGGYGGGMSTTTTTSSTIISAR